MIHKIFILALTFQEVTNQLQLLSLRPDESQSTERDGRGHSRNVGEMVSWESKVNYKKMAHFNWNVLLMFTFFSHK